MRRSRIALPFTLILGLLVPLPATAQVVGDTNPDTLKIVGNDRSLPNIAIVTTGGTIAEKADPSGGAVPAVSGQALIAAVPQLTKIANIGVFAFSNIDSSQMTPEMWARLSRTVDQILVRADVTGVVVTHGTDTMAEGAFFLDVTLRSDKPVVFTGAMNDASSLDPDGPANIYHAVVQAGSPAAGGWGVTVSLNRYINAARAVRKTQTTNVQTFSSGERGYLGYLFGGKVQRLRDRIDRVRVPLTDSLPRVDYIASYAGDDGSLIRYAARSGARGIVVDGVGAGNVNADVNKAIEYALARDVPIVITTRVYYGAVEPIYGDQGGGATLQKEGVILGGDLDGPKARILLMLGLARYGSDPHRLKELFTQ